MRKIIVDNKFNNYYPKTETYNKTEIDNKIRKLRTKSEAKILSDVNGKLFFESYESFCYIL